MNYEKAGSALICAVSTMILAACTPDNSGAAREQSQSLQGSEQATVTVGMPAITNYAEKRQLKMIYELRDTANLITYTYIIDMNGKRHKVCPTTSVGFGIPYSTQYTAPKALRMGKPMYPNGDTYIWKEFEADQPEPNALHMPSSSSGTWVVCLGPNKQLAPTYVESEVSVYTFEMTSVD